MFKCWPNCAFAASVALGPERGILLRRCRLRPLGLFAPAQDFKGGHRPVEPLQVQLADAGGFDRWLDRAEGALTDHDLAGARLAAQPRRQIGDAADRGVFAALLETDLSERRVAGGDADAEPEIMASYGATARASCSTAPACRAPAALRARYGRGTESDH